MLGSRQSSGKEREGCAALGLGLYIQDLIAEQKRKHLTEFTVEATTCFKSENFCIWFRWQQQSRLLASTGRSIHYTYSTCKY